MSSHAELAAVQETLKHLWEWLRANFWLIVGGAAGVITAIYTILLYRQSRTTEPVTIDRRNRHAMLDRVRSDWIDGVLDQSLYKIARVKLHLEGHPDAVKRPLEPIIQVPEKPPAELPPGTPIVEIFDEQGKALLILGAPGTGKTTLLLELARDLLNRAETDEDHPIPVVFNLSSWSVQRKPLEQWLVSELNDRWDVPRKVGRAWVEKEQILPLLDGLDEVAVDHRDACVAAVNSFRQNHGFVPIAVCSRVEDYGTLATKLRMRSAVLVQPLTRAAVLHYIELAGKPLAPVRAALQADEALWQLMETPLMLWVALLAYQDGLVEFLAGESHERQRARLFSHYVDAMFKRRAATGYYTPNKSVHWLSCLASLLAWNRQAAFRLENLHPGSLPAPTQRWLARAATVIGAGLVGGLIGGLVGGLTSGLASVLGVRNGGQVVSMSTGLTLGLTVGPVVGLVVGLFTELRAFRATLRPVELRFRPEMIALPTIRVVSTRVLIVGVMTIVALKLRLGGELLAHVVEVLAAALVAVLVSWLLGGPAPPVIRILFAEVVSTRRPNEGTWRSLTTSLVVGTAIGLLCGLAVGRLVDFATALVIGLCSGLLASFLAGGSFCIQHLIVRLILGVNRWAPLNYVRFLHFAVERLFLHKVGGGYIFIHRMLMEYFAALRGQAH